MPDSTPSFKELLQAAPLVHEDSVNLTGVLSRTADPTMFALTTTGGRTIILQTSAVKNHATVSNAGGHHVVSVEIDPKTLSPELLEKVRATPDRAPGKPPLDRITTGVGLVDWGSHPGFLDFDPYRSLPWIEFQQHPWQW